MEYNVATWDRIARVLIGLGLIALTFVGPKTLWGLIGLVPLYTALTGWCPLYGILRVSTCAKPRSPAGRAA